MVPRRTSTLSANYERPLDPSVAIAVSTTSRDEPEEAPPTASPLAPVDEQENSASDDGPSVEQDDMESDTTESGGIVVEHVAE